jgi:DNA-directed RNA polymerase specialized sigma24 family protein
LDRQIVDLYAFDGLLLEDIGKRLGLSVGAVKVRLHRCRKLLKGIELLLLVLLARLKP